MSRRGLVVVAAIGALVAACSGGSKAPAASSNPATIQPVASAGCKAAAALAASHSTQHFASHGTSGTYIQDVPTAAAPTRPTPIVLNLHGYLEVASMQRSGSGLSAFGDKHGFVTITPAINESGNPRWDFGPNSPDIAWIGALITHLESSLCVDERRVFVTGLSMGAFTTSAVACELSTRVAAVAPVAGLQAYPWCHPSRPVPVVAFHGTADPLLAYTGGAGPTGKTLPDPDNPKLTMGEELKKNPEAPDGPLPQSIPSQVAAWAHRNGCGATPTTTRIASDVTRFVYPCASNESVNFYRVSGGGHTWPGGPKGQYPASYVGRTTRSISASQIMWAFFQAHPLTGPVPA